MAAVDPMTPVVTDKLVEPMVIDDYKVADSEEQILVDDSTYMRTPSNEKKHRLRQREEEE
ncbi:hypothetical protein HAX54_004655, partial [Datura stramonium]|nr:hypothetical protein [Datura stramonium]